MLFYIKPEMSNETRYRSLKKLPQKIERRKKIETFFFLLQ